MPIGTPSVPYRLPGSQFERWVDIYTRLGAERILFLGQEVNDGIANSLVAQMLYLDSEDSSKPIYLYINSPGGSVTAGLAIYDTMKYVKSDLVTICVGLAASMGAFLLAAGIKPPQRVYGHGWILSGDEKMSKSKGNILDPIEIIDIYGLDALRYYLLKEVSFGNDGNISKEKLESCINSDLANNYGNLCQRVILFCEKNLGLKVPEKYNFTKEDLKILNDFKENIENIEKQINDQNINYYVEYVVNQLFKANKYFNDQAPWTKKDDSLRLNTIVFVSLELIRKISILLYPIIPNTSLKVLNIFSMKEKDIKFDTISNNEYLKDKKEIIKLGILFEKIKK